MITTNPSGYAGPKVRVDGRTDMAAFDRLPQVLRDELNYGLCQLSALEVLEAVRQMGVGHTLARVRERNRAALEAARQEREA